MDKQELDNICRFEFREEKLIKEAHQFLNNYFKFVEHPLTDNDFEILTNLEFNLKFTSMLWHSLNPQTEKEIEYYYRITPFDFLKNLYKCMDTMHLAILGNSIKQFKQHNINTVLDYGGGSGYFCMKFKEAGFDVTFAEINKLSIEWMRYINTKRQLGIKIIDLYEEGLTEVYDVIFLKDVLEHLKNPQGKFKYLRSFGKSIHIFSFECKGAEDYIPMHFCLESKWMKDYNAIEGKRVNETDVVDTFQEKMKETEQ